MISVAKIPGARDDATLKNVAFTWMQNQEVGLDAQGQIQERRIRLKTIFLPEE